MSNSKLIEEEVLLFLDNEKAFTALDITKEVNKKQYVRHSEVRDVVHAVMHNFLTDPNNNVDYVCSSISVNLVDGRASTAKLYHPTGFNPDTYTERNQTLESKDLIRDLMPTVQDIPKKDTNAVDSDNLIDNTMSIDSCTNADASNFISNVLQNISDLKKKYL
jgi:hypothetical protein